MVASALDGLDAASTFFGLEQTLCDAKTLACGDAYTLYSAAHLSDREQPPVEQRAAKKINSTLLRPAISTGKLKAHNTAKELGARDKPKLQAAVSCVLGAFGKFSSSCCCGFWVLRDNAAGVASSYPRHLTLKLLASAGGVGASSKRPFLLSGSPCCVNTTIWDEKKRLATVSPVMNTASKLGPHTQTDRGTCPGVGL